MASTSTTTCSVQAFKSHIEGFLSRNRIFRFLKVGDLCNGSKSLSFSEAQCDLTLVREGNTTSGPGRLYGIQMSQIFEAGYEFLSRQLSDDRVKDLSEDENQALTRLKNVIHTKDVYEQHILSVQEKTKELGVNDFQKKTMLHVTSTLTSKLSPGQRCVVGGAMNGKCQCEKTGIGHPEVWHGFVDIMMMSSSNIPESAANVCLDFDEESGPTTAKRVKLSEETDDEEDEILLAPENRSDVNTTTLERIKDQAAAQTIVFALAYQSRHPNSKVFIPNVIISPTKFYVVMYEPVGDVLVLSEPFPLVPDSVGKIQISSVIALWIVLHYKLFCHGSDIFEDINEIKACFKDRIDQEHQSFYQQLELGADSIESKKHVDLATTLCEEYDVLLPKLKLRTNRSH